MFKLRRFLKHYKKELILGPFFKLLEAIFELAVPLVMAQIIDKGIGNNDSDYVWKMSGLIVILGICGLGFALTCQFFAAKCAYGFGTELRDEFCWNQTGSCEVCKRIYERNVCDSFVTGRNHFQSQRMLQR